MRRLAVCAFLVLVAPAAGTAAAEPVPLFGKVGRGYSISLRDANGNEVRSLPAGPVTLRIEDLSDEHNFRLVGPGVEVATDVEGTGVVVFALTLADGRYDFQCDPHEATMKGVFTVGVTTDPAPAPTPAPTPAPSPKPSASAPVGAKLVLTVGPGLTIALRTATGKPVTRLNPGGYTVVVRDLSPRHNAHLRGTGVERATSVAGTGTTTWKVALRTGTLAYVCDPHRGSVHGSVTVS